MPDGVAGQGLRDLELIYRATQTAETAGLTATLNTLARGAMRRAARLMGPALAARPLARRRHGDPPRLPPRFRILELTGPSCLGKSTLHREALRHLACDWDMRPPKGARAGATYSDPDTQAMTAMLLRRIASLGARLEADPQAGLGIADELAALERFCAMLRVDGAMREEAQTGRRGFFVDEALFQFTAASREALDDATFARLLNCRAMVFLTLKTPEAALPRIARRAQSGSASRAYASCGSVDEILSTIEARQRRDEALQARCEEVGAPTLRLYADDPLEDNVKALCRFEQHLMTLRP
jgi:hypothetical protein